MCKYIDANKLKIEIERLQCEQSYKDVMEEMGYQFAIMDILDIIDSIQQEQSETDMKSPFTGGKVAILSREEEITFRGEKVKITRKYYRCEDTGKEFTDSKLDDDMMWSAFRAYCEKKGITSFTDIMLKQEQPDRDLEKEIDNYLSCSEDIEECADNEHYYVTKSALLSMASYFFIHGRLNAKNED